MRNREEIVKEAKRETEQMRGPSEYVQRELILEVLLDIRDLIVWKMREPK